MDDEPLGALRPGPSRREPPRFAERHDPHLHERPYGPRDYDEPPRRARRSGGSSLGVVLLALIAALAIAFAVAPFWSFRSLRSAALYGDTAALAEVVDYGAVRASLRPQLGPAPAATRPPPPDFLHDPLGALRRQFEPAPKPADVDAYLTPQALARMSLGFAKDGSPPTLVGEGPLPKLRFWDGQRVRFGVPDPGAPSRETVFTLKRRGWFDWKLVALTLPASAPK